MNKSDFNLDQITKRAAAAMEELVSVANLKPGQIVVVGCSTSEVAGQRIGSASNMEIAEALMRGILPVIKKNDLYLAVQGCEHINRALVIEGACAEKYHFEVVTVIPHQKAGGAFSTVAYSNFDRPVMVESISAHAGLDIGDTFIGMHLKQVVIPTRLKVREIGKAHVTAARIRPKLIGGERARYK